jgi:hypothetical protein
VRLKTFNENNKRVNVFRSKAKERTDVFRGQREILLLLLLLTLLHPISYVRTFILTELDLVSTKCVVDSLSTCLGLALIGDLQKLMTQIIVNLAEWMVNDCTSMYIHTFDQFQYLEFFYVQWILLVHSYVGLCAPPETFRYPKFL